MSVRLLKEIRSPLGFVGRSAVCSHGTVLVMLAVGDDDRWLPIYGCQDGELELDVDRDWVTAAFGDDDEDTAEIMRRLVAAFGLRWRFVTCAAAGAQLRCMDSSAAEQLADWSVEELRRMRGAVCSRNELVGVIEALAAIRGHRARSLEGPVL